MRSFSLVVVLALAGCGPVSSDTCSPSNCIGCCNAAGACVQGSSTIECGGGGASCSVCALGQSCTLGVCTTPQQTCSPKSCAQLGATCGDVSDGCGHTLSCGTCQSGLTCGANNLPNVCGTGTCTPKTCTSAGFECGRASDGCSTLLDCGNCPNNGTCSTSNTCSACQPRTCAQAGASCGQITDGCGAMLTCGTCTSPDTCGGGGTANSCGHGACTPTTCQALGKDCGTIDDGCGHPLMCGSCSGTLSCGGGGTLNVCGAMCAQSCPSGYSCTQGVCTGGTPSALSFDVQTLTVSGSVTLNGQPPSSIGSVGTACASSPRGWVELVEATRGYNFSLPIACMGTPAPFTGLVYPGTYKVSVRGNTSYSNLPAQSIVVNPSLVVSANVANLTFDVRTLTVAGSVTLNGQPPSSVGSVGTACASSPRGWVDLEDAANGYSFSLPVACMGTPAPFTGLVYPGTYKVSVRGNTSYSNLPGQSVVVNPSLVVSANVATLAFDVQTLTVSGSVTLNGQPPSSVGSVGTACASSPRGWVDLVESTRGYSFSLPIACMGTPAPFTGLVYPGTYKVSVRGNTSYSNLPAQSILVNPSLVVNANVSTLAFDVQTLAVSGSVTLNGQPPSSIGSVGTACASSPRGWVDLDDATRGYSFSLPIACMGTPAPFTGLVYPGTYKVSVRGNTSYSNLPGQSIMVNPSLVVSANVATLAFDVQTLTVSGSVTLNGMEPSSIGTVGTACASSPRGWVDLVEASRGYSFSLPIACMGMPAPFTGLVYPGTYKVSVRGNTSYSNLPGQSIVVNTSLAVSANVNSLSFNVQTITVSGSVTLNGMEPSSIGSVGTACASSPRGWVDLDDAANGYSFSLPIACMGSPAPFTGLVYPGTYEVSVRGNTSYSNLPGQSVIVVEALRVQ